MKNKFDIQQQTTTTELQARLLHHNMPINYT